MIGGINSGANQPYPSGSGVVRERSDVARAPAASPDKQSTEVRADLDNPAGGRQRISSPEDLQRRVEARRAAESVRLEQFRADQLPLSTSRALDAFTDIASRNDDGTGELAGIDVLI
ncbi:MAG: UDP pyrophosphate phosphatase [Pseudomonadota bacterium]|nr:UDP pyrophosphate phosphatase [Pseudomonadota bacterium]